MRLEHAARLQVDVAEVDEVGQPEREAAEGVRALPSLQGATIERHCEGLQRRVAEYRVVGEIEPDRIASSSIGGILGAKAKAGAKMTTIEIFKCRDAPEPKGSD